MPSWLITQRSRVQIPPPHRPRYYEVQAVARASYIDPRVISLYERGGTIVSSLAGLGKESTFGDLATAGHAERAVLKLLAAAPPAGT